MSKSILKVEAIFAGCRLAAYSLSNAGESVQALVEDNIAVAYFACNAASLRCEGHR
jgi:hypothetical protein